MSAARFFFASAAGVFFFFFGQTGHPPLLLPRARGRPPTGLTTRTRHRDEVANRTHGNARRRCGRGRPGRAAQGRRTRPRACAEARGSSYSAPRRVFLPRPGGGPWRIAGRRAAPTHPPRWLAGGQAEPGGAQAGRGVAGAGRREPRGRTLWKKKTQCEQGDGRRGSPFPCGPLTCSCFSPPPSRRRKPPRPRACTTRDVHRSRSLPQPTHPAHRPPSGGDARARALPPLFFPPAHTQKIALPGRVCMCLCVCVCGRRRIDGATGRGGRRARRLPHAPRFQGRAQRRPT